MSLRLALPHFASPLISNVLKQDNVSKSVTKKVNLVRSPEIAFSFVLQGLRERKGCC